MLIPQSVRLVHALALAVVFFVTKQDTRKYLTSRIRYLSSSSSSSTLTKRNSPPPAAIEGPTRKTSNMASSSMLRTTTSLNLAAADSICNGAIQAAQNDLKGRKAVCVTVLDAHGGVLAQKRMDGCPDGAYRQFSFSKARTCLHLGSSSRSMRDKYTPKGTTDAAKFTQSAAMTSVMKGELIPVAGGVLIQDETGATVGAVGVSGAAADEDEYLALKGVQVLEEENGGSRGEFFQTQPPQHCCSTLKEES
mmetsp:Transcript_20159/g.43492  ORF Transcript_20159/g.43492 Transcript_20159/m.43492 type:complete len:250 (+) Transcript_20159:225-974(+)|eukprot:CAMPEP_0168735170 /NCGR_PEP_ID=MMETSP0724-20121128/9192_1 /TAXON_ID=265536 /ORGANISM="Amphiprora sp., Strain CCMP467" /LENGTH=249 /DNA_ID=CAMNT_0008782299 /DNA_START=173 /DNA_END=922 /DNA_ORIENTATION=+